MPNMERVKFNTTNPFVVVRWEGELFAVFYSDEEMYEFCYNYKHYFDGCGCYTQDGYGCIYLGREH